MAVTVYRPRYWTPRLCSSQYFRFGGPVNGLPHGLPPTGNLHFPRFQLTRLSIFSLHIQRSRSSSGFSVTAFRISSAISSPEFRRRRTGLGGHGRFRTQPSLTLRIGASVCAKYREIRSQACRGAITSSCRTVNSAGWFSNPPSATNMAHVLAISERYRISFPAP